MNPIERAIQTVGQRLAVQDWREGTTVPLRYPFTWVRDEVVPYPAVCVACWN